MKYKTTKLFIEAVQSGKFTGSVVVDNDCVVAYQDDKEVHKFGGGGPESALIEVLFALGVEAARP